jgi:hypothetical protein
MQMIMTFNVTKTGHDINYRSKNLPETGPDMVDI